MRKITAALSAACLVGVGLTTLATGASAAEGDGTPYKTVAWKMPNGIPSWPQQVALTADTETPNVDALDAQIQALPGCGVYQVDVYDDTAALDALLTHGILGDGVVPEPGVVTWKYVTDSTCPLVVAPVSYVNDVCGTANDTYGVLDVEGIVYEQHGGWIIARTLPGYVFPDVLPAGWGVFGDGIAIDLGNYLTNEQCATIGGRTIGFWTNKNGTAAGAPIWNAAKAPYANAIPATMTFAQAQTALKVSGSTNLGKDMLRAQFIATALNVQYIAGYGAQQIEVPTSSAVDGGMTVTVTQYLADVNAAWASLDTKAEITSVKDVLDAINQDVVSTLFV